MLAYFVSYSIDFYMFFLLNLIAMELLLISMNSQVAFFINWDLICPIKPIKCESKLAINQNKSTSNRSLLCSFFQYYFSTEKNAQNQ